MHTFNRIGFSVLLLLFTSSVASAEMQSAEDHLALADKFEEKARVYENFITEHEAMIKSYQSSYESYGGQEWDDSFPSPQLLINRMEGHCNGIIKAAQSLRADMLEFAKLHKMKAMESRAGS